MHDIAQSSPKACKQQGLRDQESTCAIADVPELLLTGKTSVISAERRPLTNMVLLLCDVGDRLTRTVALPKAVRTRGSLSITAAARCVMSSACRWPSCSWLPTCCMSRSSTKPTRPAHSGKRGRRAVRTHLMLCRPLVSLQSLVCVCMLLDIAH